MKVTEQLREIQVQLRSVNGALDELRQLGMIPSELIGRICQSAVEERSGGQLEWSDFLRSLVQSGAPRLRLVPGKILKRLRRFPRSDEREFHIEVDNTNVRDVTHSRIYFVSHRWAQSLAPDTRENSQAELLITWLDKEHEEWDDFYFWIDWACIDQDDNDLKARQIEALPIYLRCCTYFVGIAWGSYWKRCWCGLEAVGFDITKKRVMLYEDGRTEIVNDRASAKTRLQRPAGTDKVWDGECFSADDKFLIKRVMMAIFSADVNQLELRKSQLDKKLEAPMIGNISSASFSSHGSRKGHLATVSFSEDVDDSMETEAGVSPPDEWTTVTGGPRPIELDDQQPATSIAQFKALSLELLQIKDLLVQLGK
jgi:hypothetical protein